MIHRWMPVPWLLLLATQGAAGLDETAETFSPPPNSEVVHERWQTVLIQGQKVGHVHEVTYRVAPAGQVQFWTDSEFQMVLGRMGQSADLAMTTRTVEDEDETVLRIEGITALSAQPTRFAGTIENGLLKARVEVAGRDYESEIDWDEGVLSPRGIRRVDRELLAKAMGSTASYKIYDPTIGQIYGVDVERGGRETIEFQGAEREVDVLYATVEILPGARSRSWVASDGTLLRHEQPFVGDGVMLFETVTKEEALGAKSTSVPDVFVESLVTCDVPIPHPRKVDEVLYEIRFDREVEAAETLGSFPGQQRETSEGDAVLLRVTRREPETPWSLPLQDVPEEIRPAMKPAAMIQCDSAEILATAREVVGTTTDAWAAAQALELWAFEHIQKKNMGTVFASATEVFQSRSGDCSEHAVLLAALCRAVGIPSRVCMGLEYVQGVFGGHAWTEVWVGEWYGLDATNAYGGVDALHLTLAASTMTDNTGLQGFATIAGAMGNLQVDVLEVRYGDRRVDFTGDEPWYSITEGRLEFPMLDLAFEVPESWIFLPYESKQELNTLLCTLRAAETEDSLEVHFSSVPYAFELDDVRKKRGAAREVQVDGRNGLWFAKQPGAKVFVLVDDTLYWWEYDGEQAQTLDDLLASVDLD